jgi:hypothetical protein
MNILLCLIPLHPSPCILFLLFDTFQVSHVALSFKKMYRTRDDDDNVLSTFLVGLAALSNVLGFMT